MKFVHPLLEKPLELSENSVNVLVIENQKIFSSLITELLEQKSGCDGEFVLSQELKELSIEKNVEIILEPFSLDLNNRRILNRLYAKLSEIAVNEEFYLAYNGISTRIFAFVEKLAQKAENRLTYGESIDAASLFKMVDLKLEIDHESLVEKIDDYMSVVQEFLGISAFIFVNLKKFLTAENLLELYQSSSYNKYRLLLFENSIDEKILPGEKTYIIDKDLCSIY